MMLDESVKDNTKTGSFDDIGKEVSRAASILENLAQSTQNVYDLSIRLDQVFLTSKTRMDEMMLAISSTVPQVSRLGGEIKDVGQTIADIAKASRRNVIENEEIIAKLYATSKVLGQSVETITTAFQKVGYQTGQIGDNVENSISYVQSIGLNAKTIMGDVVANTDSLSRFNFENGVQGLTKMASQASMLRFDMNKTFEFAEKVLDPQGAIEMASTFQRLGVAVGSLGDPFQMMNQALNDPSGLQDSLIKMTKQFTYFDEKTKSFKISPQGILTFRELEKQGVANAKQLRETALAAADLDKRLSEIKIDVPEEDKTLLANMARMGKGGKYEVAVGMDSEGQKIYKELGTITKDELEKIKEVQADAPKTMEDIARSQLDVLQAIKANTSSAADKIGYSLTQVGGVRRNIMGADRLARVVSTTIADKVPNPGTIGKEFTTAISTIQELFAKKADPNSKLTQSEFESKLKNAEEKLSTQVKSLTSQGYSGLKEALVELNQKIKPNSEIEEYFKKYIAQPLAGVAGGGKKENTSADWDATIYGTETTKKAQEMAANRPLTEVVSRTTQTDVNFDGTVTFKVEAPSGVSVQWLTDYLNSEEFKTKVSKMIDGQLEQQGVIKKTGR